MNARPDPSLFLDTAAPTIELAPDRWSVVNRAVAALLAVLPPAALFLLAAHLAVAALRAHDDASWGLTLAVALYFFGALLLPWPLNRLVIALSLSIPAMGFFVAALCVGEVSPAAGYAFYAVALAFLTWFVWHGIAELCAPDPPISEPQPDPALLPLDIVLD
jgi:hypothetical protein